MYEKTTTEPPAPKQRDHANEDLATSGCGATQSKVAERYDLICPTGLKRLARRYGLGAEKHSAYNYCLADKDQEFQRARINHAIKHLFLYLQHGNKDEQGNYDDNLGAAAWGIFTTMHFEENCHHHLAPIAGNALTDERYASAKKEEGST